MRGRSRATLVVAVLLLVTPAVGASCELASALCGPEATASLEAPPCHGAPDGAAMDCCEVRAPAESPPAASIDRAEAPVAALDARGTAALSRTVEPDALLAACERAASAAEARRYVLFSAYLL